MLKTNQYTLVSSVGSGSTELNAFDNALCNAGVGNYNLVKVSSILPPMSKEKKIVGGVDGGILPIAYGSKRNTKKVFKLLLQLQWECRKIRRRLA